MTPEEAKEVKAILANTVAEAVGILRPDLVAELKQKLTDRLTADKAPKPDFEGVKYVVHTVDGTCRRVTTRKAWIARYGHPPSPDATLFFEWSDGDPVFANNPSLYTPWHPEVGEKVRLEKEPERVYALRDIRSEAEGHPYGLDPGNGGAWWYYTLSDLRPFSFPPEDAQAETPEFENGELVVNNCARLRVALAKSGQEPRFVALDSPSLGDVYPPYRIATAKDVTHYANTCPELSLVLLRAHAKHIAEETK